MLSEEPDPGAGGVSSFPATAFEQHGRETQRTRAGYLAGGVRRRDRFFAKHPTARGVRYKERLVNRQDPDDTSRTSDDPGEAPSTDGSDPGAAWMRGLKDGDEGAFDCLVDHYKSGVFHFILASIKDEGRAEDLTQDVFVRVYRSRERYQPTARFKTWLFTIAGRLMLNEVRAVRRRRRLFTDRPGPQPCGDPDCGDDVWQSVADSRTEDPGDLVERRELEGIVKALVDALPRNQRAAIELQRSERFSYREISEILGVTPMAVKSLLVRAREKLKAGLEPYLSGRETSRELAGRSSRRAPDHKGTEDESS